MTLPDEPTLSRSAGDLPGSLDTCTGSPAERGEIGEDEMKAKTKDPDSRTTPSLEAAIAECIYGLTKIGTSKPDALRVATDLVPEVVRFIRSRLDEVEPGRRYLRACRASIYRIPSRLGDHFVRAQQVQPFQHPSEVAAGETYESCTEQGTFHHDPMITGWSLEKVLAAGGELLRAAS